MGKPRKRVRLMPVIRENSFLKTDRIPVHIIPPGSRLTGPIKKSMVIQTLPEKSPKPLPKITPSNRRHDNVEQIVSDYLHFSKYGEVGPLPVSQGFAPLACPCCLDRNRENVRLKRESNRASDQQADIDPVAESDLRISQDKCVFDSDSSKRNVIFPNRVGANDAVNPFRLSRGYGLPCDSFRGFPVHWIGAQTYLDTEFIRASISDSYKEARSQYEDASAAYLTSRILDADSRYHLAMRKLERTLRNVSVNREDLDETKASGSSLPQICPNERLARYS